jgi:hypothetical protein
METVVKPRRPGQSPEALTPAASFANDKPNLAPVGLVPVEINVTDQDASMDHPEPDQVMGR